MALTVVLGILTPLLGLTIFFAVAFHMSGTHKKDPEKIADNGYVRAHGRSIYDGAGNRLTLRGVNLGNWFVQERWMNVSGVGSFETGRYTQLRGLKAMRSNPNLDEGQIEELENIYLDNYIRESDIAEIASLGLNCVRIPFTYLNLTSDGRTLKEDAFSRLDWVVGMCKKYGLYAVLDLHGAPGSQNKDLHSGDDGSFGLYGNRENMDATVALWRQIAAHFRGESTVAAYDLLNETRRAPHRYTGRRQFDFYHELYSAVREEDPDHMIVVECFTFPVHGVSEKKYGWNNVCYSYHIYNRTFLPQAACLHFYKLLHALKGYEVPVYIGEWSAWGKESNWQKAMDFFERQGWSYTSWTYKTNAKMYNYKARHRRYKYKAWGIYELDIQPVDLSSATYEEIARVWSSVGTENAVKSVAYCAYHSRFCKGATLQNNGLSTVENSGVLNTAE